MQANLLAFRLICLLLFGWNSRAGCILRPCAARTRRTEPVGRLKRGCGGSGEGTHAFRDNDMVPVYQRLRQAGRSLPEGLEYVDSWVEANFPAASN